MSELEILRIQEIYKNKIKLYEKCNLLILDEWLLVNTINIDRQDILEVLDKRYRIHSTILCLQFDVGGWHNKLGSGVLTDAILDRFVPKSHTIKILGDKSMRMQKKGLIKRCHYGQIYSDYFYHYTSVMTLSGE
ncbi:ATP-binding protein [Thomasclavelia spiroformis]|uniref:ATP-binding protein n=1 Tax=Thomasclavelia spiroformis TaxID=29348 RepID=UPI0039A0CB0E